MTAAQGRAKAVIAGFLSETAAVDGIRLHYWIGGDPGGPPVVLIHGFLGTGYAWREVATGLAARGMAVLVPDMRGYGDSDKPEGEAGYDARALAGELRTLVAALGFGAGRPLVLAGHDMGAPPALIWAADHPPEVAGLLYAEAPVMLGDVLSDEIRYTRARMIEGPRRGSMWWWLLPFAPGVPEALVVGNERAFLTWFYDGATARREAIPEATVDEYLRSFAGRQGVLGALGVYRAAFTTIDQTEPLRVRRLKLPVVAVGGAKGLGGAVAEMVAMVAEDVRAVTIEDAGHFVPEECPGDMVEMIASLTAPRPRAETGVAGRDVRTGPLGAVRQLLGGASATDAGDGPVVVLVRVKASPGKADRLRELILGSAGRALASPGNRGFSLLVSEADPTDYTIVERWQSRAHHAAHERDPAMPEMAAAIAAGDLVESGPGDTFWQQII